MSDNSKRAVQSSDTQKEMSPEMMLDYLGIRIDSNAAEDLNFKANIVLTDVNEKYLVTVQSGVLLYQKDIQATDADVIWTMPKAGMFTILSRDEEQQKALIKTEGDESILGKLCGKIVDFDFFFNIVEP